ncbi:hypothetical protein LT493_07395 [Streptomyces tricolor]|nr:hypothetical protein [Streptomyces tricolor]
MEYLEKFAAAAKKKGLRVEVDSSSDRMQKKIRNAQKQKVPFMVIAGDEDMSNGSVSFPLPRRLAGERHPVRRGHREDRAGRGGPGPGLNPAEPRGPPGSRSRGPFPVLVPSGRTAAAAATRTTPSPRPAGPDRRP